jgi:lysozyme family protein
MADRNFERALAFTLQFEGGYVNHPSDPGGHTNKGITLATFRKYQKNATVADLKAIPDSMVKAIYRDGYWHKVSGDTLASGVDGATFDYGVNSGPSAALKSLKAAVGGSDVETVQKLCKRRLSIYQTFRHWRTFGKGWTRRITAGEALWVSWASNKAVLVKEAEKAKKTAANQSKGAGGAVAGGGGSATQIDPSAADQILPWVLGGAFVIGIAVAAYLIWKSRINKQRARAYAELAEGMPE